MSKISRPNRPLADVNVLPQKDGSNEIVVCVMPDPEQIFGEGETRAFLALDASLSLKPMYGFGGPFGGAPNYVQGVARKLGEIIASITRSNKAHAIYWAVSSDGSKIEEIGEYSEENWSNVTVSGPKKEKWGRGTKLLPALKYGYEKIAQGATGTMGVIITDGIIEDEEDATNYCLQIGKDLQGKHPEPFKLVLIGIGEEVDQGQLERFDDLFESTGIDYDLFSSGLVASIQNEEDILAILFGELMSEDTIVAPSGRVETNSGDVIAEWTDGLPGKFRFVLPKGESEFIVHTPAKEVRQDISEVI